MYSVTLCSSLYLVRFFCASSAARAVSATSMPRLVSATANLLSLCLGKDADCFICFHQRVEVKTLKACINIDHIEENRWGPPLVDFDGHAFCQAIYKGIEGSEWEEMYSPQRDMSKAARAKKPSKSQKAEALWAIKAAKDREKEFYDPALKDNILGKKTDKTGAEGRAPQRPNHSLGQSSEVPRMSLLGCPLAQSSCEKSTATLSNGQKAKALLPLSSANITWKALL